MWAVAGFWLPWAVAISGLHTFEPCETLHITLPQFRADVSTSTGIESGIVCCWSVHTTHVEGTCSRPVNMDVQNYLLQSWTSSLHLQSRGWPSMLLHRTDCSSGPPTFQKLLPSMAETRCRLIGWDNVTNLLDDSHVKCCFTWKMTNFVTVCVFFWATKSSEKSV